MEKKPIAIDRTHGGLAQPGMIDFSASINPLGPPPEAIEAYHAAAAQISAYPPAHPAALEAKFAETIGVEPQCVIAGNGSIQLIYLVARAMRARRPYVVIPTFSEIANALALAGTEAGAIELRAETNFTLDLAAIDFALDAGADAIWMGRPNSPTGSLANYETVLEIAERCARRGAWCVFDEAFIDFAAADVTSAARLISTFKVVVLRSLTKSFAIAGLRLGFLAAESGLLARLRDSIEPWSVNAAAEAVGLACLGARPDYLICTRELVGRERAFLATALASVDQIRVFPSAANFLMIAVANEPAPGGFAWHMAAHRTVIRDLARLPGCGRGMYRIAVRTHADNERLVAAAKSWRA
jgi:threonine-phosphate decarboxylase